MTEPHPITRALLATIGHSTQPMVVSDPNAPDHPMIAVNGAFTALTGYAEAETVGRNCRFLQGADTGPETPARIRRCIAEQRGCIEWVVNYRRDGTRFWNLLFISPVFTPEGALLHFFGNQRDISNTVPPGLPDYVLGRSEMPAAQLNEFQALLAEIMAQPLVAPADGPARATALEAAVDAARRLNEVTLQLKPTQWTPPSK